MVVRLEQKKKHFIKRKDRFWFEKFARQKNDKEVVDFLYLILYHN